MRAAARSIINSRPKIDWHQPGGLMPPKTIRLSHATIVISADVVERLARTDRKLRVAIGSDPNFHQIHIRALPTGYAMKINPSGTASLNITRLFKTFGLPIGDYYDHQGINTFALIEKLGNQ